MILKQFGNLELLGILPQRQRNSFSNRTVFSVMKTDLKKIREKGVWTNEATTVLGCEGFKTVLETVENKKNKKLLCGPRF